MTQPSTFGDRYELGELIGYGGMAEVHRGRDLRLNRDVAIKVLRADLARDPAFLNRFRREAHSAAGLNHPSIVSVYDTGENTAADGNTQPFIVMEYVQGRTLRDIVKSEGSLPPRRAMEITADICAALDFSHRNGIIHRDIKPANVMITPQGSVKVMDFGIARAVADNSATVTQTANVIGTAQYLSPEQARGETVDARSDVYSTGCLLYELITGAPPFQGDSPVAVAYQHVRENPVMPSARKAGVPRVLDSIVMKALAKNQLNRYQSAGDMRSDLQRALADQPVVAEAVMTDAERTQFIARTPPPVVAPRREEYEPPPEDDVRHTGLIWAAVVVALLLVIGIGAFVIIKTSSGGGSDTNVKVPSNLIGLSQSAAEAQITAAKLTPKQGTATSGPCDGGATGAEGKVCTVSPRGGQSVARNATVTYALYVKPAAKAIQVPPVTTQKLDDAYAEFLKKGIPQTRIKVKRVNELDMSGNAVANEVLSQSPDAYGYLQPGDTALLTVATGKLVLPKVAGETFDSARQDINGAGFSNTPDNPVYKTTSNKTLDGKVSSVNPTANGKIAYASDVKITITVYRYVKPAPSCTTVPPSASVPSGSVPPSVPPTSGVPSSGSSTPTTGTSTLPPCK